MFSQESIAPSYGRLKPLKPPITPNLFPVYGDLVDVLAKTTDHPNDETAYALSVCAGYAYATADNVSMLMARMGLPDNACRMVGFYVDPMFISSTAFLVQSSDGRVVILAYRGTEPDNFINWLTDLRFVYRQGRDRLRHPPARSRSMVGSTATCERPGTRS